MLLDDIPMFSMLKDRLSYLSQRQQVIAQNVANSDTPGYTPNDLAPFALPNDPSADLQLTPVPMTPAHLGPDGASATRLQPVSSPDTETRLDGNRVVLEEEMMKMTDARLNYETALGFYQKSLGLIQLAIKAPGKP